MPDRRHLSSAHLGLVLLVIVVWGTNFVVIKWGLRDFPPFEFALLRFFFSAVPFVFFIPRPKVAWRWLVLYGVLLGPGQFGLLFYAMRADISPGLTSLVVQAQAFFTIALSVLFFKERVSSLAVVGMALGAAGLGVIGLHLDASVNAKGVITVLIASLCWGFANIVVKRAARDGRFDMVAFIVWASVFAVPPLIALTLVLEGAQVGWNAIAAARLDAWLAVGWQALGNTVFAFTAYSWLLSRYDAAVITPYALLIPIVGMASSAALLGEPLPPWKFGAAALVLAGIALATIRWKR